MFLSTGCGRTQKALSAFNWIHFNFIAHRLCGAKCDYGQSNNVHTSHILILIPQKPIVNPRSLLKTIALFFSAHDFHVQLLSLLSRAFFRKFLGKAHMSSIDGALKIVTVCCSLGIYY